MKNKKYWTEPKIKTYPIPGKKWYVWFRINGGNPHRFFDGINIHETYEERMQAAIILRESLITMLNAGWIPEKKKPKIQAPPKIEILDALDFAMEKLKLRLAEKSFHDYLCTCRFVKDAVKRLKLQKLKIDEVEKFHVKTIFENIKEYRQWSNHAYNKNLGYFKSILTELEEYGLIKINPAHGIKTLKYDTPPTTFPTDHEQTRIVRHLYERNFAFLRFIKALYQTGIVNHCVNFLNYTYLCIRICKC